ncbi:MAG: hypothetical protein E6J39_04600 [Chloroflexi bacterium]|nr:MAG: hypothetical protein E6J39_04600 [Chloroflexota bacterium]
MTWPGAAAAALARPAEHPLRTAAPTALAVLAGLSAAYLLPPLAIVLVWPILFVVPGWGLIALARPRLEAPARLGLAIVLSVAMSAHLVYWLSLALGYRRETIFLAAALLACPLPVAAATGGGVAGLRRQLIAGANAMARNRGALALAFIAAAFVGGVLANGLWHVTPAGVDSGGSNWSDLGVHLSIAQSLNAGNFPPQVPYFAGVPLVYHWFADFHAAIAARAAGIFAIPAFIASSALLAGALALIVHGLGRALFRRENARRAALIAAGLAIFAGGFGWIRLVGDVTAGLGNPIALVAHNSYDNGWYDPIGRVTWPYFRIPSVMGTGLLVHRATTAGLPMLVGVTLLLVAGLPTARQRRAGWRDRPLLIGLAGLLGAMLAPFHFFFFPAGLLLAFLWAACGGRLLDRDTPRNAALFLAPYLVSLPYAVAPFTQASGSGALRLVPGWESAPFSDGPAAVAFFYVTNLGLPVVLAAAALLAPRTPARWFLGAWAIALFLIPNVVQVSVIGFDMNKYFQAMAIASALLAGWLMRRWPLPALAVVFALAVPSPLLVSAWTAFNREQVLSADQLAAANWIAASTPGNAVFATDGWLNSPTDPAGRLRLTTFGPYVANLGYKPDQRGATLTTIYCGGNPARSAALMAELHADYLIDGGRPSPCEKPVDFAQAPGFIRVYANPSLTIYRLSAVAASAGARAAGAVSASASVSSDP